MSPKIVTIICDMRLLRLEEVAHFQVLPPDSFRVKTIAVSTLCL